jgi:hypothetical protein
VPYILVAILFAGLTAMWSVLALHVFGKLKARVGGLLYGRVEMAEALPSSARGSVGEVQARC